MLVYKENARGPADMAGSLHASHHLGRAATVAIAVVLLLALVLLQAA
jgi:hypothetical protein